MTGQNLFINQPLAIDTSFLLSVLPSVILGYKNNSFLSQETILEKRIKDIEAQADFAQSSGADRFPIVFNISGPIVKYSDWGIIGTQTMMRILSQIDKDTRVSGILFNIDSGGGMVSGTAEFADFISKMEKPTISWTNDTQCSAAEWIASACQYKMAGPFASSIGSIGTFMSFQDYSAMFEKWGAKIYSIYAPESTDKNSDFKELMKGNQKPYEEKLSAITQDFIETIKTNYGDTLKDDGHVFKGKTYNAKQALEIGLIQEIGSLKDALSKF